MRAIKVIRLSGCSLPRSKRSRERANLVKVEKSEWIVEERRKRKEKDKLLDDVVDGFFFALERET
jgi:hypothetical protein